MREKAKEHRDRKWGTQGGLGRRLYNLRRQAAALALGAGVLAGAVWTGDGGMAAWAAETEDPLIEDSGEEFVVNSGADLDELKAAEQEQTEPATEPVIADETLALEPASAGSLENFLTELTKEESPTGSDGELEIGAYIRSVMEGYGYTVSEQNFHEGFLNENGVDAPGVNIIAERGADAQNRYSDILIVSTHYDSKTSPEEGDPLANDKSGSAVLLETARILANLETDTDVCFLFLSGEEDGLYGSLRFVESLEEEYRSRIVGQIHVQQVGYGEDAPFVLMTVQGQENRMETLVRQEGLAKEQQDLVTEEDQEGSIARPESQEGETGAEGLQTETDASEALPENWDCIQDRQTSIQSFAQAGIQAVTLTQVLDGADLKGEEVPRTDQLQKTADILAAAVGRIMSSQTGSLLGQS